MDADGRKERLKAIRKKRYSSLKQAAGAMQKAGSAMSPQTLHRLECGQWPSERQLEIICGFYGVTPEWLLFGVDDGLLDKLDAEDKADYISIIKRQIKRYPPPQ